MRSLMHGLIFCSDFFFLSFLSSSGVEDEPVIREVQRDFAEETVFIEELGDARRALAGDDEEERFRVFAKCACFKQPV